MAPSESIIKVESGWLWSDEARRSNNGGSLEGKEARTQYLTIYVWGTEVSTPVDTWANCLWAKLHHIDFMDIIVTRAIRGDCFLSFSWPRDFDLKNVPPSCKILTDSDMSMASSQRRQWLLLLLARPSCTLSVLSPSHKVSPLSHSIHRAGSTLPAVTGQRRPKKPNPLHDPLDESRPSIEIRGNVKGPYRQNVAVSANTNSEELIAGLAPLIERAGNRVHSLGAESWFLDHHEDAINRFFAFTGEADADQFVAMVGAAADHVNHHPTILKLSPRKRWGNVWPVAISCGTHRPRGLSMRDIRLAKKINEISAKYDGLANTDLHPNIGIRKLIACKSVILPKLWQRRRQT